MAPQPLNYETRLAYQAAHEPSPRRDSFVRWSYLTVGASSIGSLYRAALIKGELDPLKNDLRKVGRATLALLVAGLLCSAGLPEKAGKAASGLAALASLGLAGYLIAVLKKHQSEIAPMVIKAVVYLLGAAIAAVLAIASVAIAVPVFLVLTICTGWLLAIGVKNYIEYNLQVSHLMHASLQDALATTHGGSDTLWSVGITIASILAAAVNVGIYG